MIKLKKFTLFKNLKSHNMIEITDIYNNTIYFNIVDENFRVLTESYLPNYLFQKYIVKNKNFRSL